MKNKIEICFCWTMIVFQIAVIIVHLYGSNYLVAGTMFCVCMITFKKLLEI